MINFRGSVICPSTIQKLNDKYKYKDFNASFVALDPMCDEDVRLMDELSKYWSPRYNYAANIDYMFNCVRAHESDNEKNRFYILAEDYKLGSKLDVNDVYGMVQLTKTTPEKYRINFLQVKPEYRSGEKYSPVKRIGSSILNTLSELYNEYIIYLYSMPNVEKFYLKNGYEIIKKKYEGTYLMERKPKLNKLI